MATSEKSPDHASEREPALRALNAREKRLFLLERVGASPAALRVARAATIGRPIPAPPLAEALSRVIAQSAAGGIRFDGEHDLAIVQVPPAPVHVEETPGNAADAARQWAILLPAFQMDKGPLVRAAVFSGPTDTAAIVVAHRAVADASALDEWLRAAISGDKLTQAAAISLDDAAVTSAVEYAKTCLSGIDEPAELLGDRARPPVHAQNAKSTTRPVPAKTLAAAERLSAQLAISQEEVFSGAFAALIARYTRRREVLFGRRHRPAPASPERAEAGIHARENDVLIRATLAAKTLVREHFLAAAESARQGEKHAAVPMEVVLSSVCPPRDASRSPLYQVGFSYRMRPVLPEGWAHLDVPVTGSAMDLAMEIERTEGSPDVSITILENADIFTDEGRAPRLLGHLSALIEGAADALDKELSSLPIVRDEERRHLIFEGNAHKVFPSEDTLAARVQRSAEKWPDAIALSFGEESVTYREMELRATRIAKYLREQGVVVGSRVGVVMERTPRLVITLYAILKAGGAYVPVEPTQPKDRITLVMTDNEPKLILTDKPSSEKLSLTGAPIHLVDELEKALSETPFEPLSPPPCPDGQSLADTLAYIIYTSGSTGTPKGCLIRHRDVIRLFDATHDWYHFNENDVWTFFHSVAFDFSVWEIWGALTFGGRLVVVPYSVTRSPDDFRRTVSEERVTVLNQTPSAFRQFMEADARDSGSKLSLREVIFGGEALDFQSLRPWFDRHGDTAPRLVNMYGITETTVFVTYRPLSRADLDTPHTSVIGVPIPDVAVYVVDEALELVPIGVPGELLVSSAGVSEGYWRRPELTRERFLPDPFEPSRGLCYRSGDLVKRLPNGEIDYLGRIDQQVKIRGYRIEIGEVEAAVRKTGLARDVVIMAARKNKGESALIAYVVTDSNAADLKAKTRTFLPEYMVPSVFVRVPQIPMTDNGKVDRRALPDPWAVSAEESAAQAYVPVRGRFEEAVAAAFAEITGRSRASATFHFFDEGGSSLGAVHAARRIGEMLGAHVPVVKLFEHPTVEALARYLEQQSGSSPTAEQPAFKSTREPRATHAEEPIAIVGASGRFPGAATASLFWKNLLEGKESIRFFKREELDPSLDPEVTSAPSYVLARGVLDAPADFDAPFFGMSPREAEITDPQQRLALELAWEALESAGHEPSRFRGAIGVYAGEHAVTYYIENVLRRPDVLRTTGGFLAMLGNEKDYIAMRIAYKLGLDGPALSIHTACSTSLVAVVSAVNALRSGQCDMALAGGVSLTHPAASGYVYQEEAIASPDGHTRPFDEAAQGTVFSDGGAFLVLRRLSDAERDGDTIWAVIRGAALNNDGGERMSFMAPTPKGQAAVIASAIEQSGVPASSIGYVEAHGTATPIGDPIEIEGLRQAFGPGLSPASCAIGSLKSNIGHLAAAAGAAGLIKAALAVKTGVVPGTLHFQKPNPKLQLESSPFYVMAQTGPFPTRGGPRRAGVSSFGVGGTNAHVVIEEPPPSAEARPSRRDAQLFVVSARTATALTTSCQQLSAALTEPETQSAEALSDVAFTLGEGRRHFMERRFVVAKSAEDARRALDATSPSITASARVSIAFAFPGQGSQYIAMGRELSRREPVFRDALQRCLSILNSKDDGPGGPLLCDLKDVLDPHGAAGQADLDFVETAKVQPAIFAVEYALAQLWESIGIKPDVLIGHSIGEIVAATLSGVFDLKDALRLVYHRGRLMQAAPPGVMLSIRATPEEIEADLRALGEPLAGIAVVNSPKLCVAGGPDAAMTALAERLSARNIPMSRLRVSHAFHTPMMDGVLGKLAEVAQGVQLSTPRIPIISTVTTRRLNDAEARSPEYWTRHVRESVLFAGGLATLWTEDPDRLVIEVGPRGTLTTLSRQIAPAGKRNVSFASLEAGAAPQGADPDEGAAFCRAVGAAWAHGASIDWKAFYAGEARRRVPLPTYPFERKTYLIAAPAFSTRVEATKLNTASAEAVPGQETAAPEPAKEAPKDRRSALLAQVRAVFEEASGTDISDPSSTFMDLGLDSLSLTQCAQLLTRRVGGDVTFRQLVEGLVSLNALVDHLLATLPENGAATAQPVTETKAPSDLGASPAEEPTPKKTFGAGARIERTGSALPQEQETALGVFMSAYIARTPKSKAYAQEHREVLADPRVVTGFKPMWKEVVYPIVVDRSEGSHLWDIDGNQWIDLTCGFGANFFGHRPPYVVKAVHEQLDKGFEIGPQHPLVGECAKLVRELTGHERVVFCNTGSEAILGATRLARTVSNRPLVVSFSGDYHGILDEVILRGTKSLRSIPGAPGILPSAVQNNLVLDYGEKSALDTIRAKARDIAAVVVEPVQSRRPDLQPRAFLKELRALTEELGIALVFDEIITGFRLCPGGAQEYFGIQADLATYGKILGGGLPIGAIAGHHHYMDALDGGAWRYGDASVPEVGVTYFAGTFVRHPLALAACKASLEYVKSQGPELQRKVTARTAKLVRDINADLRRAEAPYDLATCGSWFKINYADDLPFGGLLFFWLRLKGLHIWDGRVAFLTTEHTDEDCARIRDAFASAIAEMQAAGFLPKPARKDPFVHPPMPGARIGKTKDGLPAWFVPDTERPGKYLLLRGEP